MFIEQKKETDTKVALYTGTSINLEVKINELSVTPKLKWLTAS